MASSITPDITHRVFADDYARALEVDGERWADHSSAQPAWQGTTAFRLLKGVEDRAFWRVFAIAADRDLFESEQRATTAAVATVIARCSFRSQLAMEETACQLLVAEAGRSLTVEEHSRVITSVKELWAIAIPRTVETYELTDAGRAAVTTPNDRERVA